MLESPLSLIKVLLALNFFFFCNRVITYTLTRIFSHEYMRSLKGHLMGENGGNVSRSIDGEPQESRATQTILNIWSALTECFLFVQ